MKITAERRAEIAAEPVKAMNFKQITMKLGSIENQEDALRAFAIIDRSFNADRINWKEHEALYNIAESLYNYAEMVL